MLNGWDYGPGNMSPAQVEAQRAAYQLGNISSGGGGTDWAAGLLGLANTWLQVDALKSMQRGDDGAAYREGVPGAVTQQQAAAVPGVVWLLGAGLVAVLVLRD